MSLYPYWCDLDNFGDRHLNQYLMPLLFPGVLGESNPSGVLYGIGSILHSRPQIHADLPQVVFSSGFQYKKPLKLHRESMVYCVRGRYTCKRLGLPERLAIADGGILLPLFMRLDLTGEKAECVVKKWDFKGAETESTFSSRVPDGLSSWLKRLLSFRTVATDALHAAIIADAYGVPWTPLRWEPKWDDHFSMLGVKGRPKGFVLSDRKILMEKQDALLEARASLLKDFTSREQS